MPCNYSNYTKSALNDYNIWGWGFMSCRIGPNLAPRVIFKQKGDEYMSPTEINSIFKKLSDLDFDRTDTEDQIILAIALCEFADTIKPVVDKYSNKTECRKDGQSVFLEVLQIGVS